MESKPKLLTDILKDVSVFEMSNSFSYIGTLKENLRLYNSLKVPTKASDTIESQKKLYSQMLLGLRKDMPTITLNSNQVISQYRLMWEPKEINLLYIKNIRENIK